MIMMTTALTTTFDGELDPSGQRTSHQFGGELHSSVDKKITMKTKTMVVITHITVRSLVRQELDSPARLRSSQLCGLKRDNDDYGGDNYTQDGALESSGMGPTHQLARKLYSSVDKEIKVVMTTITMIVTIHMMVHLSRLATTHLISSSFPSHLICKPS